MNKTMTLSGALAALFVSTVSAETVNFGTKQPTTEELIDALTPKTEVLAPRETVSRSSDTTRGIRKIATATETQAVSVELKFEFDSHRLTNSAKRNIDAVGYAINSSKLSNYRFRIEGHTDAIGSERYNQVLSERRAQEVVDYLVREHNVELSRVSAVGYGESKPLENVSPEDASNRRVAIVNLQ